MPEKGVTLWATVNSVAQSVETVAQSVITDRAIVVF